MKTRVFIPAALALLSGLSACNNDESGTSTGGVEGTPIVFTATGLSTTAPPTSRATIDGDWQGVTSVAVTIDGTVKEYNVTATSANYTIATLTSDAPHYWTSRNNITVSAWWPYTEGETALPDVVVQTDQHTLETFAANDFISAENQTVEYDNPTLTFTHRTARVAVELKRGTDVRSVTGAVVNLTSLSTTNGNPATIQTYNASANTHEALATPQTVAAGNPFIQVKLGDGIFDFRPQNDIVLEASYRYTYTIKVNATGLTLEGYTIGDWTENDEDGELNYIYDKETNTYNVYTANGLLTWAEAAQNDLSTNCILAADIDLTGMEWTPIGDYDNQYTGTFDGKGHTITGLTVNQPEINLVGGLVNHLKDNGTVKDLTFRNLSVSGNNFVGGVVGYNYYGTVTGCTVSGTVSGNGGVGGIVGENHYGTVTGCTAPETVTGNGSYVGSVVGYNLGPVTACVATGTVSGNRFAGGIVGCNSDGTVTACYHASDAITAQSDYAGGVVGQNWSTVTACYWSGSPDTGIGSNEGSGFATQVDGENVTWQTAVDAMNAAINEWNGSNPDYPCNWQYELTDDNSLPTLKKEE